MKLWLIAGPPLPATDPEEGPVRLSGTPARMECDGKLFEMYYLLSWLKKWLIHVFFLRFLPSLVWKFWGFSTKQKKNGRKNSRMFFHGRHLCVQFFLVLKCSYLVFFFVFWFSVWSPAAGLYFCSFCFLFPRRRFVIIILEDVSAMWLSGWRIL